jgi:predicted phosphodiesterase
MNGLTWLHLSDWHQKGEDFDRQVVLDALISDIADRAAISPLLDKIDFIVFSGDVAQDGKEEEYEEAVKLFFNPILKASRVDRDKIFIVPGNHDLDKNYFNLAPGGLSKPLKSYEEIYYWLNDEERRYRLLEPFKAFSKFVRAYSHQEDDPSYANIRIWKIGGKNIALLGINSAWMCGKTENDMKNILIGEPQIHKPLQQISNADIRIAILHHPFDWLPEFERDRTEGLIRSKCNFVLCGHTHKPRVEARHDNFGDSVIIPAGASYRKRIEVDPRYTSSYNFVHLELIDETKCNGETKYKVEVFLRRWSEQQRKWISDVDSCIGGKFETVIPINVHLPDFEIAQIGPLSSSDCMPDAWEALYYAVKAARLGGSDMVGTPHLFKGMLQIKNGCLVKALKRLGIDLSKLYGAINISTDSVDDHISDYLKGPIIEVSPNTYPVLQGAKDRSKDENREKITELDILTVFVKQGGGLTGRYLREKGIILESLISEVLSDDGQLDISRFDLSTQKILKTAMDCAHHKQHFMLGRRHLLYAMLVNEGTELQKRVRQQGLDPEELGDSLYIEMPSGTSSAQDRKLTIANLSPETINIILAAENYSKPGKEIGEYMLLRALLEDGCGSAGQFLVQRGIKWRKFF